MYELEFKITGDNSHTLLVKELNETYHSTKGAIVEAKHVFIQKGLADYIQKTNLKQLNVFEVGFGTGLNAHLSQLFAVGNNIHLNYISIEAHPLKIDLIKQLNYPSLINSDQSQYLKLHDVEWDLPVVIDDNFTLTKIHQKLAELSPIEKIDVIFFDAFAPDIQPEMWSKTIFENMYHLLKDEGVLVTYCAKGIVKRTLKEVGFTVENLPGPPGKREMTRAVKN